jgi:hypothetical protein
MSDMKKYVYDTEGVSRYTRCPKNIRFDLYTLELFDEYIKKNKLDITFSEFTRISVNTFLRKKMYGEDNPDWGR